MGTLLAGMKNLVDYKLKVSPFLLIHQDRYISSWLGFFLTLIVLPLSVFICWDEIIDVIYKKNRNTEIKHFLSTKGSNTVCPSISVEDLNFSFFVMSESNGTYYQKLLDDTFFQPELFLVNSTVGQEPTYTDFIFEHYKAKNNSISFTISGFAQIPEEKKRISICSESMTALRFRLYPCTNETNNRSECKPPEEIFQALENAQIMLVYTSNIDNYEEGIKNNMNDNEALSFSTSYISIDYIKEFEVVYQHMETNFNNPFGFFDFFVKGEKSKTQDSFFQVIETKERNTPNSDIWNDYFYQADFYFNYHYKFLARKYESIGKIFKVHYKTFPEVLASISAMIDLLFFVSQLLINIFFGYFDGNYYTEVINSFFGDNKKYSNMNRKKKIKIYEAIPQNLNNISLNLNNNKNKSEILLDQKDVKFSPFNKISTGVFSQCCKIKKDLSKPGIFRKEIFKIFLISIGINIIPLIVSIFLYKYNILLGVWYIFAGFTIINIALTIILGLYYILQTKDLNGLFFNQASDIIRKHIDIIFILQKIFEFEKFGVLQKLNISSEPKLISGIEPDKDDNFYERWIREQNNPLSINQEENDEDNMSLGLDSKIN